MLTQLNLARGALGAAMLAAALAGCASGLSGPASGAASSIAAPAGEMASMTVVAHGVQIYECRAAGQPPADGCSLTTLGSRVHMAYRADYVLYTPHS